MSHHLNNDDPLHQAAQRWLTRLHLEEPTTEDQEQFRAWLTEDVRHAAAYRNLAEIWHDTSGLTELTHLAPLEPMYQSCEARMDSSPLGGEARRGRRTWFATAAAVALAASLAAFTLLRPDAPDHYTTQIAEVRDMTLPDGSNLTLGARSAIDVAFTEQERNVTLASGEAYFTVTRNPSRPFVVTVGDKRIRAVGTQFEVRKEGDTVRVAVIEGLVEVDGLGRHPGAGRGPVLLSAGQQLLAHPSGEIEAPRQISLQEPAAWRNGRLMYIDAPLREIVADANRYSHEHIELASDEVAELRVSVTYRADQVDDMINGLAQTLPVEVTRPAPDRIVLVASPDDP